MNRYDFTQAGGFPLDQGVLKFLQEAIGTASLAASLAGPLSILSGCEVVGGNMAAGYVCINGEILPFITGAISAKIIIQEVATPVVFQDGSPKVIKYVRSARFGDDGTANYPYASFKRNTVEGVLSRLERLEKLSAPLLGGGSMMFWNRPLAEIPAGYQEAIDWRGRMPFGVTAGDVDFNAPGKTGGAKMHTNTVPEMASHYHAFEDEHGTYYLDFGSGSTRGSYTGANIDDPAVTDSAGGGEAWNIMNPYRTVYFIEPIPGYFN